MAEYHVACGMAGIYAGTVKPNGVEWKRKSLVTDEAINAVRDYMFSEAKCAENRTGSLQYEWKTKDGRVVTLELTVKESKKRICPTTGQECSECKPGGPCAKEVPADD